MQPHAATASRNALREPLADGDDRQTAADDIAQPPRSETHATLAGSSAADKDYDGTVRALLAAEQRYPRRAKRRRLSGVVVIAFRIMADGRVERGRVLRSSGSPLLDEAAMTALMKIARFPPLPSTPVRSHRDFQVPLHFRAG